MRSIRVRFPSFAELVLLPFFFLLSSHIRSERHLFSIKNEVNIRKVEIKCLSGS